MLDFFNRLLYDLRHKWKIVQKSKNMHKQNRVKHEITGILHKKKE